MNKEEKVKSRSSEVHRPKMNLKLLNCKEEVATEMGKAPLDSGTLNISAPSPGVKFGVPASPGVFDLQSPVVMIGEDVFQIIGGYGNGKSKFSEIYVKELFWLSKINPLILHLGLLAVSCFSG